VRLGILAARMRLPLIVIGVLLIAAGAIGAGGAFALIGLAVMVAGLALYFWIGGVRADPIRVRPPIVGRWAAVNSPGSKVPSHGLHAWGQTYAVDLLHVPRGEYEPTYGWSDGFRPPEDFPSFGQPVLAPGDGVVVNVDDRQEDHASRTSWPALAWFFLEGLAREAMGARGILGNHVILRLDDGMAYAALAHLRHGSALVRPGERVRAGQQVAECGNTGNSTEPHVHFQVMDLPRAAFAAGLPFRFTDAVDDDGRRVELPATEEVFIAAEPASTRAH
jgi:hypothetical protein